jgi:hypothetical protein
VLTVFCGRGWWLHAPPSQIHRTFLTLQKPSLVRQSSKPLPLPSIQHPPQRVGSRISASDRSIPIHLYKSGSRSQMSDYHVRSPARDQRDPQTRNLRSRSSSRDMSWRKPVPKLLPSPPISPDQVQYRQCTGSPTATTFGYMVDRANPFSMSLTSLKNDLPPVCGGATLKPHSCHSLVKVSC